MRSLRYLKVTLAAMLAIVLFTVALSRYIWLPSYFRVGLVTTLNIVLYVATSRHYIWLEGRVRRGVFRNWVRHFRYTPPRFVRLTTEEKIVELVRDPKTKSLRVFGAGHSFNDGVVSGDILMSLDDYSGSVQRKDLDEKQIAVKGGTRIREVVRLLSEKGLAFEALPSHDAQSIAGILSTDVHGTGRIWGFVSKSVVRLKLVDGKGEIHECEPSDDLFKAAIGGVGAVGIITEVVVQGVDRFNVEQKSEMLDISFDKEGDKENFDQRVNDYLRENEHFSLYLFPFADKCQVNTWKRTNRGQTRRGVLKELRRTYREALAAAWIGNFLAYTGRLPRSGWAYGFKEASDLVLESSEAFNRTIYHQHQELEFTVPFEDTFECCKRFIDLYKSLYPLGLPYTIMEVRFTPANHDRTLIGAGRDRHSTWIDLLCNDSLGYEKYYAEAEELIKEIGARPHLGKFCKSFTKADMAKLHGDNFTKFLTLVEEHDPDGKFANGFTQRLFRQEV